MNGYISSTRKTALVLVLLLSAFSLWAKTLDLPANNEVYSKDTALQLLDLGTRHLERATKNAFNEYGIKVLHQENYHRPQNQIDHSSAFTIGKGNVLVGGKQKSAYVICIRGSDGTEWYSNFDFAPSGSNDTKFAMNFLTSAEEVFLEFKKIAKEKNPYIVITGHSRGGAVSNLLGLFLNSVYDSSRIFVYTFATPNTIRNIDGFYDKNIFNFINPCDVVPNAPPANFGFRRAGTDILLDATSEVMTPEKINHALELFKNQCKTIEDYYNKEVVIPDSGFGLKKVIGNKKMTFYKAMMIVCTELAKLTFTDDDMELDSLMELSTDNVLGTLLFEHMPNKYAEKLNKL